VTEPPPATPPQQPEKAAGAIYRLASGDPYAVEIRPGARVQISRAARPDGPVTVTFSDPRTWPSAGDHWVPVSLVLPADVAQHLAVHTIPLIGWGELPQ
jgi:hypothetical protein